ASGAHKEDLLSLKFNFVARDGDGDSANGAFIVKVIDDAPTAAGNAIVALDDDSVAPGATDRVVTGVVAHDYGADGAGAVSWLGTGMKLGNNGLWYEHTSATELVITQMQGGVYVQIAKLTITDQSTGTYTVEQLRPVVHPSGGGENNIQFTVS